MPAPRRGDVLAVFVACTDRGSRARGAGLAGRRVRVMGGQYGTGDERDKQWVSQPSQHVRVLLRKPGSAFMLVETSSRMRQFPRSDNRAREAAPGPRRQPRLSNLIAFAGAAGLVLAYALPGGAYDIVVRQEYGIAVWW